METERRLRVIRVLEMEGPETWVRQTLAKSYVSQECGVSFENGATLSERSRKLSYVEDLEE